MCKHKNCKTESTFITDSRKWPIDDYGFCLFHSNNDEWQIQNDFAIAFYTLIQNITKKNKDITIDKWNYYFEGFNFPENLDIEIKQFSFIADLKFSNCNFKSKITFAECDLIAFTIRNSIFHDNVIFNKTNIKHGIYSELVKYNGSFKLLNLNLQGNTFFKDNTFSFRPGGTEFLIKKCSNIEYVSFENTSINISTAIVKSTLNKEIRFVNCEINDEFIFDDNIINDSVTFNQTYFTITENTNPIYSSTHFENITLTKTGKISFKGKDKQDNVVFNELSISFKTPPLGHIIFENFNLNKVFYKTKERLLSLEKQGLVEIGKGCRKYYCQTETFTINANNASQELILSLAKIFCNYFELSENKNLGIEIVERTKNKISYFYFTDEEITSREFAERLNFNEFNIWHTFSNLTIYKKSKIEDIESQLLLDEISSFFNKLGTIANHKSFKEDEMLSALNSASVKYDETNNIIIQGKTFLNFEGLTESLRNYSTNLLKLNPISQYKTVIEMNITNNFTGKTTIERFINTESYFENNNIEEKEKEIIIKELKEIHNELDEHKKESKIKKFIKEWSGTITDVGMTIIKNSI